MIEIKSIIFKESEKINYIYHKQKEYQLIILFLFMNK